MKKNISALLALLFYFSILPTLPVRAAAPVIGDLIVKNSPYVDVRAYGAVGNGVADDTAAIVAAIVAAQAVQGVVFFPPDTYLVSTTITLPAGVTLLGPGAGNMQAGGAVIKKAAGNYTTVFDTDDTDSSFLGLTIANLIIKGGTSATWSDVANKWAITSHYPFTKILGVHIEPDADYFGNGIKLHNDSGTASMGAWLSKIEHTRYVGTPGIPENNDHVGLNLTINGGGVTVRDSSFQHANTGIHIHSGEGILLDEVDLENIKGGAPGERTGAAIVIGDDNTNSIVRGVVLRSGYIEAIGRAVRIGRANGVTIDGSYINTIRAYSSTGGSDGLIYISSLANGVTIKNNDITNHYNNQSMVYSDGRPWTSSANTYFQNVTGSSNVPQTWYGDSFGGTTPNRLNDKLISVVDGVSSDVVSNVVGSGSLVKVTTSGAHGLSTGNTVFIASVGGVTGVNGIPFEITVVDSDEFTLNGSLFAGTYTSGGTVYLATVTNYPAVFPTLEWTTLSSSSIVRSGSGSGSIANGATATLFTGVNPGTYDVVAWQSDDPGSRTEAAIVVFDSTSSIKIYVDGTDWTLGLSGANVQLQNTSGMTRAYKYTYRRIN